MERLVNLNKELSRKLESQIEQISDLEEHIRGIFGQQQEKAVGVILRMFHSQLHAGFCAWRANVEEIKRHESILKKFSKRIKNSLASKAFLSFKANAAERKFLKKFVKRMCGDRRTKMLSAGFISWKSSVAYLKENDAEIELDRLYGEVDDLQEILTMYESRYAKELLAKKGKARRVILKLLKGKIHVAFEVWSEWMKQEQRNETLRIKFAKKMRFRGAMKALACWKALVHERKFLRRLLMRMFGGKEMTLKSAGFRKWCDSVRGYKKGQEKQVIEKLEDVCVKQSDTIDRLREDLSFLQNQIGTLQSEKASNAQKAMANFIALWQNKGLFKVFTAWKGLVAGMHQRRLIVQKIVLKRQNKLVLKTFKGWSSYVSANLARQKRSHLVKEGEWQDFLRDARTGSLGTPKESAAGNKHGAAFFGDDDENNVGDHNTTRGYGGGRDARAHGSTPTMDEMGALEYLSPKTMRSMTTQALMAELKRRGLPVNGTKPALMARLTACQDFLSPRSSKAMLNIYRTGHEQYK